MGASLKKNLAALIFLVIILIIIACFILLATWTNHWIQEKEFIKILYQSPIQLIPSLEINSLEKNYGGKKNIYNLDYQEFKDRLWNILNKDDSFEGQSLEPFIISNEKQTISPIKYIKLIRKEPNTLIIKPIFFPINSYIQLEDNRKILVFLVENNSKKEWAFLSLRGKIPEEYKNVPLIKLSRYHKVREESINSLLFNDFFQRHLLVFEELKNYLESGEFKRRYPQELLNIFDIKHIEFYKNQFIHFFIRENKFYNLEENCQIILDVDKLKRTLQKALIYIEKLKKEDKQEKKIIRINSTFKNRAKVSYL